MRDSRGDTRRSTLGRPLLRLHKLGSKMAQRPLLCTGKIYDGGINTMSAAKRRAVDVTWVPPGALERMRCTPALPTAELRAAIERARQRRSMDQRGRQNHEGNTIE